MPAVFILARLSLKANPLRFTSPGDLFEISFVVLVVFLPFPDYFVLLATNGLVVRIAVIFAYLFQHYAKQTH